MGSGSLVLFLHNHLLGQEAVLLFLDALGKVHSTDIFCKIRKEALCPIDSEMAGVICVKLSGLVEGMGENNLAQNSI